MTTRASIEAQAHRASEAQRQAVNAQRLGFGVAVIALFIGAIGDSIGLGSGQVGTAYTVGVISGIYTLMANFDERSARKAVLAS